MEYQDAYSFCRPYLANGEYILWKGKPAQGNLLTASDIIMIPFSIFWCGFAFFWELSAIATGAPFFFALFGLPFICIGLYMVFGRFVWTGYIRKRTAYVITNQKIIRMRGRRIDMLNSKSLPPMQITIHKNGNGTIHFNRMNGWGWNYSQPAVNSTHMTFSLENLPDITAAQQAIANMEN